jgi:hypothetical protein
MNAPSDDDENAGFREAALASMGLPDSPVIREAITTIAGLLRPLSTHSTSSPLHDCIQRFRWASHAALGHWPIEYVRLQYLSRCDMEIDPVEADAVLEIPGTDWLGQAKAALEVRGILDTGPDAKKMASRYGWGRT